MDNLQELVELILPERILEYFEYGGYQKQGNEILSSQNKEKILSYYSISISVFPHYKGQFNNS